MRILLFLLVMTLGCGGPPPPVENGSGRDGQTGDVHAQRTVQVGQGGTGDEVCTLETVHFAFDDHLLDARSRGAIDRAVQCWRRRGLPAALHLVGATDPRGTVEYNMALGERRAQSVRQYLVNLGVGSANISVMSVGEEEATGQDEEGWARDRHVRGVAP